MKINYSYIKILILLLLVGFLHAFSSERNKRRIITQPNVEFTSSNNLFLTHDNVSKLLIQNPKGLNNKHKDIIDLNALESALNSNPMVKNAEVYMSVNGELTAQIEQKRPIARVYTNASFYVDDEGSFMPLSVNHSARVPLVTGKIYKSKLGEVYKIAKKIDQDQFLKHHVVEINQAENQDISLRLRQFDFVVVLGNLEQLEKKINNFKAFYKKAVRDKTINTYSRINLRFDNQVVCTKK